MTDPEKPKASSDELLTDDSLKSVVGGKNPIGISNANREVKGKKSNTNYFPDCAVDLPAPKQGDSPESLGPRLRYTQHLDGE